MEFNLWYWSSFCEDLYMCVLCVCVSPKKLIMSFVNKIVPRTRRAGGHEPLGTTLIKDGGE